MMTSDGFNAPAPCEENLLLAIDVGNTNITFGVFDGEKIEHQWRIHTNRVKTSDEYGIELKQILMHFGYARNCIKDVIISSVVPDLVYQMTAMSVRYLKKKPMIVGSHTKTGINIKVDNPKELGSDRVVNAVGAYALYGGPVLIIDLGTAIKHDVVTAKGEYLGGTIAPGIGIAMDALFSRTSKLPKIELSKPEHVIGRNTIEAMRSGIVNGYLGLIDHLTLEVIQELTSRGMERPKVVATGGFSSLIISSSSFVDVVNRDLTLQGLRIVYERTIKSEKNG
ncbi:MAG: type III pantothenate kinase [Peptoniphilaceae bacterium]|nr:type III pantothenate kinase [Peptoniphilaceae bacterium]MDY6085630.1 type III pantothenate kinase [Peptoniphilaceae bacterium]